MHIARYSSVVITPRDNLTIPRMLSIPHEAIHSELQAEVNWGMTESRLNRVYFCDGCI